MNPLKSSDMALDPSSVPKVLRPVCRIGASAVSCVFPPMAIPFALIGSVYSEISQQSTQKMLDSLGERLDELESKNLVSQDYLDSEHYVHLMVDILRKVYAFNSDQKREAVAKIYKDVVQNKVEYADSDEKLFIEAIERINTQEIVILRFMEETEEALKSINSWEKFYKLYFEQCRRDLLDKYKFKLFAMQLEMLGLVFCSDLFGYDANFRVLGLEASRPCSAGITPMGKTFLRYLKVV